MALGRDNNIRSMPCLCGDPSLPYSEYSRPQSPYVFDLTSVPSFRPSLLPIRNFFPSGSMCICSCPSLADMGDIGAHRFKLPCSTGG